MKCKLSALQHSAKEKIAVPDIMHFVWVGDSRRLNVDYIDIWRKANQSKVIYLWLDESSWLCHSFHESIQAYVFKTTAGNHAQEEISIKNRAFKDMFPKLKEGYPFDRLVIEFLSDYPLHQEAPGCQVLNERFQASGIVIKSISELFTPQFDDFKRFYYYEMILRGNLASASDIVRLLILYLHGGIYIDTDTLPFTDNAFSRLNHFLACENIAQDDALLLMKNQSVLKKLSPSVPADGEHLLGHNNQSSQSNITHDNHKQKEIKRLIDLDMAELTFEKIRPLGEIRVYKNLLALGSLRRLKGIYFNHFMASYPQSKSVRMILRVMKKRYKFLEKNECIFGCCSGGKEGAYLSRLLTWRTELMTKNYCVTSALTGPGLILEVLLGLAYQLLDLEDVDPACVAEFFQNEHYGIALYQHNLDTPEGYASTWRS